VAEKGASGVNCPDVFVFDREAAEMRRVSVSSLGVQGNSWSASDGAISADGRYVAFSSAASNLVSGDMNNTYDVFVHDLQTGQTSRVSVSSAGTQGNRHSYQPQLSADGRYVAFSSAASNLVPGDINEFIDIFVHDRLTGETSRVSVSSEGMQANHHSFRPAISADGRFVAFYSDASNLVSGDTNRVEDVFVHDRESGQTRRVSVSSEGVQGDFDSRNPSISADGRYVAFSSDATNLVSGDTNGTYDIFVHDRETGQTRRVSVASDGTEANGKNFGSHFPYLTADGRFVTFGSFASNLVPGDTNGFVDIFVHDLELGQTTRVSVSSDGEQGNNDSYSPSSISDDGRYVAFYSDANNLAPDDTNGCRDIFIHDRQTGQTERLSVGF
jgi:Tol biopolymer transport system component